MEARRRPSSGSARREAAAQLGGVEPVVGEGVALNSQSTDAHGPRRAARPQLEGREWLPVGS